jgi:hypothetical protein
LAVYETSWIVPYLLETVDAFGLTGAECLAASRPLDGDQHAIGNRPASLLADLYAFLQEHRRCGESRCRGRGRAGSR